MALAAPYRAIPRDYLSDTPLLLSYGVVQKLLSNMANLESAIPLGVPLFWKQFPLGEQCFCERC